MSLSEYESGINSVKSTNRNYLQSYYSPHQNIVNGVTNGAYSVTLNANRTLNFIFMTEVMVLILHLKKIQIIF